ncbi:hypothetical protein G4B88_005936 [Cannabis sativa]|uniref:Uncharacterized protein n=1 Tax=Cannabis sativa TaxID=3483 RepID=A0A7J6ICX9_CANSA|nr:hypothetical protein G4B88_005936 [Cannabis sativa]
MIARNQEFKSRNRGKQSPAPSSVSLPALEVEKDLQEKALSIPLVVFKEGFRSRRYCSLSQLQRSYRRQSSTQTGHYYAQPREAQTPNDTPSHVPDLPFLLPSLSFSSIERADKAGQRRSTEVGASVGLRSTMVKTSLGALRLS